MTQYVQIAVPKELYDKLGLHLNQTITLTCSQDTCELDTRLNVNDSDEASNEHHKLILSKKSSVDGKSNDSSTKRHDGTFQVVRVNPVGYDSQSGLAPSVTVASPSIDSPGCNNLESDDSSDDMAPNDFDAISGGEPASKKAKIATPEYPRNCGRCKQRFLSHAAYSVHEESCRGFNGEKDYLRMCSKCHRCYFTPTTWHGHKRNCIKFSRTQSFDKHKSLVKSVLPSNASDSNLSGSASIDDIADVEGSEIVNAEEKWIPVTNLTNAHKYFIVKK